MPRSELEALLAWVEAWLEGTPPANVWIGATVVNQEEADRDIPKLLAVPAAKRFLSMEPLLGPVDLTPFFWGKHEAVDRICQNCPRDADCECGYHTRRDLQLHAIDWVIVGGESGPHARPLHPDWVRSLRNQCGTAGVPFFFKQWGEYTYHYDRDRYDPDWERCDKVAMYPGRWINAEGGHGFHGKRVHYAHRVGKKAAGRLLDGRTWDEVPK